MEYIIDVLVGGAITVLNNMKVNGKDDIPYIIEKNMIETTNQFSMNFPCFCGAQFWIHPQMGLSQGKKRDFWKTRIKWNFNSENEDSIQKKWTWPAKSWTWHQTIVTFISIQPAQNFFFTQETCELQLTQQNCGFCPLKNASAKPGDVNVLNRNENNISILMGLPWFVPKL